MTSQQFHGYHSACTLSWASSTIHPTGVISFTTALPLEINAWVAFIPAPELFIPFPIKTAKRGSRQTTLVRPQWDFLSLAMITLSENTRRSLQVLEKEVSTPIKQLITWGSITRENRLDGLKVCQRLPRCRNQGRYLLLKVITREEESSTGRNQTISNSSDRWSTVLIPGKVRVLSTNGIIAQPTSCRPRTPPLVQRVRHASRDVNQICSCVTWRVILYLISIILICWSRPCGMWSVLFVLLLWNWNTVHFS